MLSEESKIFLDNMKKVDLAWKETRIATEKYLEALTHFYHIHIEPEVEIFNADDRLRTETN